MSPAAPLSCPPIPPDIWRQDPSGVENTQIASFVDFENVVIPAE